MQEATVGVEPLHGDVGQSRRGSRSSGTFRKRIQYNNDPPEARALSQRVPRARHRVVDRRLCRVVVDAAFAASRGRRERGRALRLRQASISAERRVVRSDPGRTA